HNYVGGAGSAAGKHIRPRLDAHSRQARPNAVVQAPAAEGDAPARPPDVVACDQEPQAQAATPAKAEQNRVEQRK
ncbi:hypothetical protein V2A35_32430, partial [Pseudomonas aeruginosa]